MSPRNVIIVGSTGAVGQELLRILEQREFPLKNLKLTASAKSRGRTVKFRGETLKVEELKADSFAGQDIGLFSAGGAVSKEFAPVAVKAGCVVVDNTSAWRMDPDVPLVVPEVNAKAIAGHRGIIANPNCSTIGLVVVLKPLHDKARCRRCVVTTFQSVSGAGARALEEMIEESKAVLAGKEYRRTIFPHPIAFNCIPQIGQKKETFQPSGYTDEETKMIQETKKILEDDTVRVAPTCVRVPVMRCHSESVNLEFSKPISADRAREILRSAPGVRVVDDPSKMEYPLATMVAGKDESFVGRIRQDPTVEYGLHLWIVSDNIRKGAALNAVQIAELL
ncbi:MAG: aspartate-semialdehyde dehydrogenase [Candidatus Brocadiae bacterium]|nr:aspartate-semialdehyde dehydrogenase [Candidatus Brocadiia bacterium]